MVSRPRQAHLQACRKGLNRHVRNHRLLVIVLTLTSRSASATPNITVVQNWDDAALPNGAWLALSPVVTGTTDSVRFRIKNTGNTSLTLNDATSLVSGSCFSQIETPSTIVPAGGAAYFRVRIQCSTPGIYVGNIIISSNDPDTPTYRFTVVGPALPASAGDLVLMHPRVPAARFWNAAGQDVTFRHLPALLA
jgi:hypothetical protein